MSVVVLKVAKVEGKMEDLEAAVDKVQEDGDEAVVFAQSVVGGETVEKFVARGVKMYDREHGGHVDLPEADKTIDLEVGVVEDPKQGEKTPEDEGSKPKQSAKGKSKAGK